MTKPRTKTGKGLQFPYRYEKNSRTGYVKKWKDGKFGTYFRFAGKPMRNSFKSFEKALQYLEREFTVLDTDRANSLALNPLNADVRRYAELEQLLRDEGDGATLNEAVSYYLANHRRRKFKPETVATCAERFVASQTANNISPIQIKTLEKHFRRFKREFATRKIHEITALEISEWLTAQKDEKRNAPWSVKTRISNLGSLVSLSIFARDTLKAIPGEGKTEFQTATKPLPDARGAVEIYTPNEMRTLLLAAFEHDLDLLPVLVIGAFQGMRPAEIHGEGAKRPRLTWEAFLWDDNWLHVTGQKIRSKANREIPLHKVTRTWLEPFRSLKGAIWRHTQAHSKKMISLRKKANVRSIYDGFRHSYASYRIRPLKGNLQELAQEMGNSPREIINSYKRNVTDAEAEAWFAIKPPPNYAEKVRAALRLREAT